MLIVTSTRLEDKASEMNLWLLLNLRAPCMLSVTSAKETRAIASVKDPIDFPRVPHAPDARKLASHRMES